MRRRDGERSGGRVGSRSSGGRKHCLDASLRLVLLSLPSCSVCRPLVFGAPPHRRDVAQRWIECACAADARLLPADFRLGFHAVPSLPQLHMHVVSQVRTAAGG